MLQDPQLFDPILQGAVFAAASVGPSGLAANFGDNLSVPEICPMQAWISARHGRQLPAELAGQHPFDLVWGRQETTRTAPPNLFLGNHLVTLRGAGQGWLAVSAGTADHAHAHHDLGSFLWETDGVRFVTDPGRLDYARKGYFKAERFEDFGASAAAHNLPVFEPVSMKGWRADIVPRSHADQAGEVVIRSTAPQGEAEVSRHFILTDGALRIEDRILRGREKPLRWQFHTDAQVERDGKCLLLRKMAQTVRVSVEMPYSGQWVLTPLDAAALGLVEGTTATSVSFELGEFWDDHRVAVRFERVKAD